MLLVQNFDRRGYMLQVCDNILMSMLNRVRVMVFNDTLNNILDIVSGIDGGNRSTRRKPPTCSKSLTNFIT